MVLVARRAFAAQEQHQVTAEHSEGEGVAVISAKNHKRQSVTVIREKSLTPKFLTAILTLPNVINLT